VFFFVCFCANRLIPPKHYLKKIRNIKESFGKEILAWAGKGFKAHHRIKILVFIFCIQRRDPMM